MKAKNQGCRACEPGQPKRLEARPLFPGGDRGEKGPDVGGAGDAAGAGMSKRKSLFGAK
jgi:hypothetical protein